MIEIIVRILHTSLIKQNLSFVLSYVDKTRKEKAERFRNEKDQLLSLGAGYLMKKYLPEGEIKIMESGKPYLPNGPFFNVSHSGEYVVFTSSNNSEVGIDIELIKASVDWPTYSSLINIVLSYPDNEEDEAIDHIEFK